MATDITIHMPAVITLPGGLPDMITAGGNRAAWRFVEFFTATIRNPNTCEAYARAIVRFLVRGLLPWIIPFTQQGPAGA